ncbi:hypothetical protein, conserved [Babesia bigemina]|uniref:Uncharacterized protein n=1 Tax=Babesia bigemina TaxID=5866 RepID=A0A061D2V9_BABBI|nr:hypothetical protein, conserved [Babesia bigemina]CDR94948.1 hypothetical protein, conserved [Babesia bigemina]|eukprot:XP_012767134.1 hypothetical protein, conserved [Babesia bigemina]
MKRSYEDPSLELIGRSAAERRLDRFYNRQRSKLRNATNRDGYAIESKVVEKKELPFQPSESTAASPPSKTRSDEPNARKSVRDILYDLSQRHLPHRGRFAKSVKLLTKLCVGYLSDRANAEYAGLSLDDFFRVFLKLDRIFIVEFGGGVPKDCVELKNVVLEFVESVVDRLLAEADISPVHRELMHLLKLDLCYSASLWYENDSFRFHAIVSQLESHFKRFEAIASERDLSADSEMYNNTPSAPSNPIEASGDQSDSPTASSNNGGESPKSSPSKDGSAAGVIPNSSGASDESKQIDGNSQDCQTTADSPGSTLPSEKELQYLQHQAFVRALAVVFGFCSYPWAKVSIETLFQKVYLRRELFCDTDQQRITDWQRHIKAAKGKTFKGQWSTRPPHGFAGSLTPLGIGESSFQVQDARDEKIVTVHGSQVWSNRQFGI